MRRNKTLEQQAKYYEVSDIFAMCDVMIESWINGSFQVFKSYYLELKKTDRKLFINYAWNNVEDRVFYKMIDFLFF